MRIFCKNENVWVKAKFWFSTRFHRLTSTQAERFENNSVVVPDFFCIKAKRNLTYSLNITQVGKGLVLRPRATTLFCRMFEIHAATIAIQKVRKLHYIKIFLQVRSALCASDMIRHVTWALIELWLLQIADRLTYTLKPDYNNETTHPIHPFVCASCKCWGFIGYYTRINGRDGHQLFAFMQVIAIGLNVYLQPACHALWLVGICFPAAVADALTQGVGKVATSCLEWMFRKRN